MENRIRKKKNAKWRQPFAEMRSSGGDWPVKNFVKEISWCL